VAKYTVTSRRLEREAHDLTPIAPRYDWEDLGMARDGHSGARGKNDLRADIDALEEMIVRLLADPRITHDSPVLMAARTVLDQRRVELARISTNL
jgi:hypothetical protein